MNLFKCILNSFSLPKQGVMGDTLPPKQGVMGDTPPPKQGEMGDTLPPKQGILPQSQSYT